MISFKHYCETQDQATLAYGKNINTDFIGKQNKSFEEYINPIIEDFIHKVKTTLVNQYSPKLNQQQINHIVQQLSSKLSNVKYNPREDLGNMINQIFRTHNNAKPTPIATTQKQ